MMHAASAVAACGAIDGHRDERATFRDGEQAEPTDENDPRGVVIYSYVRRFESMDDVEPADVLEYGELDLDTWQKAARPYTHQADAYVYQDEAWEQTLPDGGLERGYRVWRKGNPAVYSPSPYSGPPTVEADVLVLQDEDPMLHVPIVLTFHDFPSWDVPLLPDTSLVSVDDLQDAYDSRAAALAARAEKFEEVAAPAIASIEELGGSIISQNPKTGWLIARVPSGALVALISRDDLASIGDGRGLAQDAAWYLGEGRTDARLDVDRHLDAGYTGEQPNSGRHAFGDITIAVIESKYFEDDACYFFDGAGCTGASRLQEVFQCNFSGNECQSVTNFADDTEPAQHGTWTSSIALADYRQGQGNGNALGDASWTNNGCASGANCASGTCESGKCAHSSVWEERATGMAPEARAILFGGMHLDDEGLMASSADAWDDAFDRHVDIISASIGTGPNVCSPAAFAAVELEAQVAFDDGIFMAVAAGNSGINDDCNVNTPAAIPKSFAVNGYTADGDASCQTSYHTDCLIDNETASKGGADGYYPDGTFGASELGIVALSAPGRVRYTTNDVGSLGEVQTSAIYGSSFATPHVAGAAAIVKDRFLSTGQTWINNPGYLHTVMFAMGDRHNGLSEPTTQRTTGASHVYGFGRLKLRLFDSTLAPYFTNAATVVLTDDDSVVWSPTYLPLGTGTAMVKCVALHIEDTSADADDITISNIDLTVRIKNANAGSCPGTGTPLYTRSDTDMDWKHMVAIEDTSVTLNGRCVEVEVSSEEVEGPLSITSRVFCYGAGVDDDDQ